MFLSLFWPLRQPFVKKPKPQTLNPKPRVGKCEVPCGLSLMGRKYPGFRGLELRVPKYVIIRPGYASCSTSLRAEYDYLAFSLGLRVCSAFRDRSS